MGRCAAGRRPSGLARRFPNRRRPLPRKDRVAIPSDFDDGPRLPVQAGYAAWALALRRRWEPPHRAEGPAVREAIGSVVGRRVDVGCGTGRHALTVPLGRAGLRRRTRPHSRDDPAARRRLPGRAVHWARHALPSPLPFRDGTFDLAVLGLVAEHIEAIGPALREVARVLVPGGRCVLSNLHPDRTAEGQAARFIDPETGERRAIVSYHRTTAEYLAAVRGGPGSRIRASSVGPARTRRNVATCRSICRDEPGVVGRLGKAVRDDPATVRPSNVHAIVFLIPRALF